MGSDRLTDSDKAELGRMMGRGMGEAEMATCVRDLCSMLERHHGTKAVLLVDEYDSWATHPSDDGVRGRMASFMGNYLSCSLRENGSLQMACLVGVLPLAEDGAFALPDRVRSDGVLSRGFDGCFGLSEDEVRSVLRQYGEGSADEVREWFGGYRFGDAEAINPFALMTYISKGFVPGPYWAATAGDFPFRRMVDLAGPEDIPSLSELFGGGPLRCRIRDSVSFSDLTSPDLTGLLSLMVHAGHLRAVPADDGGYELSIPNRDVMGTVDRMMDGILGSHRSYRASEDADGTAAFLRTVLDGRTSCVPAILALLHRPLRDYRASPLGSVDCGPEIVLTPDGDSLPSIIIVPDSTGQGDAISRISEHMRHIGIRGKVVLVGLSSGGGAAFVDVEDVGDRTRHDPERIGEAVCSPILRRRRDPKIRSADPGMTPIRSRRGSSEVSPSRSESSANIRASSVVDRRISEPISRISTGAEMSYPGSVPARGSYTTYPSQRPTGLASEYPCATANALASSIPMLSPRKSTNGTKSQHAQEKHMVWKRSGFSPWRFMALFCRPARKTVLRVLGGSMGTPAAISLSRFMSLTRTILSPGRTFILHSLSMTMSMSWSVSPRPYSTLEASLPFLKKPVAALSMSKERS